MPGNEDWGGTCQIWTRRSGFWNGSGSRSTAWTTLKMAVFAPIPRARIKTATMANPGLLTNCLKANFRLRTNLDTQCDLHSISGDASTQPFGGREGDVFRMFYEVQRLAQCPVARAGVRERTSGSAHRRASLLPAFYGILKGPSSQ